MVNSDSSSTSVNSSRQTNRCVKMSLPGVPGRPLGPPRPLSPSKPGDPGKPVKIQNSEWVCFLRYDKDREHQRFSFTFGSRSSRTSRQTRGPVLSSSSWVEGLTLWSGETRGACGGDEIKMLRRHILLIARLIN